MKRHTAIYMGYFGFQIAEDCICEICGSVAVDIHHIKARGMGGDSKKDVIENLQALCRNCHNQYGDVPQYKEMLLQRHLSFMRLWGKGKK